MANEFLVADRVKETSTTTGTGAFTLAGAVTGYQSFAIVGDGNYTYYVIEDGTWWETGIGLYTSSGTTLTRTAVIASSGGGGSSANTAVNWGAGSKNVFCTGPAPTHWPSTTIKTSDATLTAREHTVLVDSGSGAVTITLPDAAAATLGRRYMIKKINTGTLSITIATGAGNIDHASSQKLYLQGDCYELACAHTGSGFEWIALSRQLKAHSASLIQTSAQSPSGSAAFTCTFESVEFEYGADGDVGNNYIDIQRAGVYDCFAFLSLDNISSGACFVYVSVDGTALAQAKAVGSGSDTGNNYISGSVLLDLAAGAKIRCLGYHQEMGGVSTIVSTTRLQSRLQVSEVL
jgi:hypothetical protein